MSASVFKWATPPRTKTEDYDLAAALGVSPRTIKAYRLGERVPPVEAQLRLLEWRRQRAEQQIAEGRQELQRIESEARLAGLGQSASIGRILRACGLGSEEGPSSSAESPGLVSLFQAAGAS